MRSFWLRLRTYWRRRRLSRDFDDEISFHLATRRERLIAEGASPEEAEIAARRAFGSTLRAKEALGEVWAFRWLDDLGRDIGFAIRTFRRSPVFALTAVLSLALGIGAATAIYAIAHSMLWRPMPVRDPDRLVAIYQTGPIGVEDFRQFSYPELLEYRRQVSTLVELAGSTGVPMRVTDGDRPELVWGQVVTDNFFSALQIEMAAGRAFRSDEDAAVAGTELQVLATTLQRRPSHRRKKNCCEWSHPDGRRRHRAGFYEHAAVQLRSGYLRAGANSASGVARARELGRGPQQSLDQRARTSERGRDKSAR